HFSWQTRGEKAGTTKCVFYTCLFAPIGPVDVLLDAHAVEGPVREGVDGEYVESELVEQRLELRQCDLFCRARGEAQPHAEARGTGNARLRRADAAREDGAHFCPRFSGVDVRAIRQVRRARELREPHVPVSLSSAAPQLRNVSTAARTSAGSTWCTS